MKPKPVIWILEDDPDAQAVYEGVLSKRYDLRIFSSIAEFSAAQGDVQLKLPNLMLLDMKLPDGNVLESVLRNPELPAIDAPFIVASWVDDVEVLRSCFADGAQDYLVKPFSGNELVAKVEKCLEETAQPEIKQPQSEDELHLDALGLALRRGETTIAQFTPKELQIFSMIYRAQGAPVARRTILDRVWPDQRKISQKSLDVHIFNIRRKIRPAGLHIHLTGLPNGYRLVAGKNN